MSGKARGFTGPFAAVFALFAGAFGCNANAAKNDCRDLCQRMLSFECTDSSLDECTTDCQNYETELPEECQDEWATLRDCASEAEWSCQPPSCDPELELCPEEPDQVIHGCESELSAFEACDSGDVCSDDGGGGSTLTSDGRTVEFSYSSICGQCSMPPAGGSLPSFQCVEARDCVEHCCACGDRDVSVQVCLDGLCASEDEACSPSLGACDGFR